MAIIAVSGQPGCRTEEAARLIAQRLAFEFVSESLLERKVREEFGANASIPGRVYPAALTSVLATLAREHQMVLCAPGSELLVADFPGAMSLWLYAPQRYRVGTLMVDYQLERSVALELLEKLENDDREYRKRLFGRAGPLPTAFDLAVNKETFDSAQLAEFIGEIVERRGLSGHGVLTSGQAAEIQFHARLRLARHGLKPEGKASLARRPFMNESEEIFANLLDFYRIPWEYEPRSFPVQWDRDGRVAESFTPDFYLPEFDLYIELTTMKQANVTRKNRKVKLLRAIYPHINIQVFYQKDFQGLVFKYGLAERPQMV